MFYPMMAGGGMTGAYASVEATAAQNAAREASTGVELLKHDIDRLLLISEALWTLMKQEHGYADDVLIQLIQGIESKRTIVDGITAKAPPLMCPSCGRPNTANRQFCMYCGKPIAGNPFAR